MSRKTWQTLREKLIEVTGYENVYYQPPSVVKYPCIRMELTDKEEDYADNIRYQNKNRYTLSIIRKSISDDSVIDSIMQLMYTDFDRRYVSTDNLYHDIIIIYW